jgi:hypothetical protein
MKNMKSICLLFLLLFGSVSVSLANHHEEKKTRVGTCADAKKQQDYFCDMKKRIYRFYGGLRHCL